MSAAASLLLLLETDFTTAIRSTTIASLLSPLRDASPTTSGNGSGIVTSGVEGGTLVVNRKLPSGVKRLEVPLVRALVTWLTHGSRLQFDLGCFFLPSPASLVASSRRTAL